jgi:peptidoglycan lytic transglycosylase G
MDEAKIYRFLIAMILTTACLIVGISAYIVVELPKNAEISFGPASKKLGFIQKTRLSARLLLKADNLTAPAKPNGSPYLFKISRGESVPTVARRLQQVGLISDASVLQDYLVYSGIDTTLQAGEFELNPNMNPMEIAWALQDATPSEISFSILPGWRLEEIAAGIPTSGLEFSPESFLAAVNEPSPNLLIAQQLPAGASLEGFLYPDIYRFPRKISVDSFLETILQDFDLKLDRQIKENFQRQGLSLFEAVTLASIVQREAVVEDEMPLIASVFLNRLNAGMKLDTDPTVQYALGYDRKGKTWWKNPLSLDDLQVNSPYNTYLNPGLPPGPIANPGLSALKAVAFPAQSPYYYFRSDCDGSGRHSFAKTFEEHQQNACPD